MRTFLLIIFLALLSKMGLAQTDSTILKMPLHNGKLEYSDGVKVVGKTRIQLDTTAKSWFKTYFKYKKATDSAAFKKGNSSLLSDGALEFKIKPTSLAVVRYKFYVGLTIRIDCKDNLYTYKISDIYFMPENNFIRNVGTYEHNPDYLLDLYKKKHLGLAPSINFGRKKIAEYLLRTNEAILNCIASLNQAMTK